MDRRKVKVDSAVRSFVVKVNKEFKPVKIILFGSRAFGEPREYSDYDFIVVSDNFKKVHWLKRIEQLVRCWESDKPIDVLPYTLEEFEEKKKESSMIREAVKKGVEV